MTNQCPNSPQWKDQLLDAALTGTQAPALANHLSTCPHCARELADLESRRQQLDSLLPRVAPVADLPRDFRPRVLAAAQAAEKRDHARSLRAWRLTVASALAVAILIVALRLHRTDVSVPAQPAPDVAAAQRLAEWRAPSDTLLVTPGREILQTIPKLDDTYFRLPATNDRED